MLGGIKINVLAKLGFKRPRELNKIIVSSTGIFESF